MNFYQLAGIFSGIITFIGLLIYAKSIVAGPTKPSATTWLIWTINSFLLMSSYIASGAKETAWLALAYAIGLTIITILTLKIGEIIWNRLDQVCLLGAIIGAILWWITGSSLIALIASLVIDLFGVIPTIQKSWSHPEEESKLGWSILLVGGIISIFAIKDWSITVAAYPIQITLTTALIVVFLFWPSTKGTSVHI
ncbi:MAG: hypothetical protein JWM56_1159 [Candidatus Peribacteria bacterium]|nr:hypothetical protein [Candidatus Peribacteria bacterium]